VRTIQKRKTSAFGYGPLIKPKRLPLKIAYKYNSMLTYIPVSFLFSFKKGFGLGLKIGFGFGIGNLIGGAVGAVGWCARKTPV